MQPNVTIFLNLFVIRLIARFISMSSSFLNFLCPMHTLLVSYLVLGSLFHTIEHKFCGLSTGLRVCVKATKFYYYYLLDRHFLAALDKVSGHKFFKGPIGFVGFCKGVIVTYPMEIGKVCVSKQLLMIPA